MTNNINNNIARFSATIKNLAPAYEAYHREEEIKVMQDILQKASVNEVSVLICGEFKRGKSSFINAFLDKEVCPTDVGIATSSVSIIKYGEALKVTRYYGDVKSLKSEEIDFGQIEKYAKGSSTEIDNTWMLVIEMPSEKFKNGMILIDTPGVGGLDPRHLFLTLYVMPKADITLFVVDANEPLSATELDFYKDKILRYASSAKIILNKSDLKGRDELATLINDIREKIAKHCNINERIIDIIPVSSLHWMMYNKSKNEKYRKSSNCDVVDTVLANIVPTFKNELLLKLKKYMLDSLDSIEEVISFQISQIEKPDEEKQVAFRVKLEELNEMKKSFSEPNSSTRQEITRIIQTTQSDVINELTRQSILLSTDGLNQLLSRPEVQSANGREWLLNQLNLCLEAIASEVDKRIQQGFIEVSNILGGTMTISDDKFAQKISVDLTPAERDLASKACGLARNALPMSGVAYLSGTVLSVFLGPVAATLGGVALAIGYFYQSNKMQNTAQLVNDLKTKLTPQIQIAMSDLKTYVQQRFTDFNKELIDTLSLSTNCVIEEMQQVMLEMKAIAEGEKKAGEMKKLLEGRISFISQHREQIKLLLTNPFAK